MTLRFPGEVCEGENCCDYELNCADERQGDQRVWRGKWGICNAFGMTRQRMGKGINTDDEKDTGGILPS